MAARADALLDEVTAAGAQAAPASHKAESLASVGRLAAACARSQAACAAADAELRDARSASTALRTEVQAFSLRLTAATAAWSARQHEVAELRAQRDALGSFTLSRLQATRVLHEKETRLAAERHTIGADEAQLRRLRQSLQGLERTEQACEARTAAARAAADLAHASLMSGATDALRPMTAAVTAARTAFDQVAATCQNLGGMFQTIDQTVKQTIGELDDPDGGEVGALDAIIAALEQRQAQLGERVAQARAKLDACRPGDPARQHLADRLGDLHDEQRQLTVERADLALRRTAVNEIARVAVDTSYAVQPAIAEAGNLYNVLRAELHAAQADLAEVRQSALAAVLQPPPGFTAGPGAAALGQVLLSVCLRGEGTADDAHAAADLARALAAACGGDARQAVQWLGRGPATGWPAADAAALQACLAGAPHGARAWALVAGEAAA